MKTMLMQNLGGQTKSIMVFFEVAYYLIRASEPSSFYKRELGACLILS